MARWGGLRLEPYKPDAIDADNDGIVQEGTAFERPAGTRLLNRLGTEILSGLQSADPIDGLRVVDAEGKDVSYRPSWVGKIRGERDKPGLRSLKDRGIRTVGDMSPSLKDRGLVFSDQEQKPLALPGLEKPKPKEMSPEERVIRSILGDRFDEAFGQESDPFDGIIPKQTIEDADVDVLKNRLRPKTRISRAGNIRISENMVVLHSDAAGVGTKRPMLLVQLRDGTVQPFYRRSGTGSPEEEAEQIASGGGGGKGQWVPFDGFGLAEKSLWLRKHRFEGDGKGSPTFRYGNEELRRIGLLLDDHEAVSAIIDNPSKQEHIHIARKTRDPLNDLLGMERFQDFTLRMTEENYKHRRDLEDKTPFVPKVSREERKERIENGEILPLVEEMVIHTTADGEQKGTQEDWDDLVEPALQQLDEVIIGPRRDPDSTPVQLDLTHEDHAQGGLKGSFIPLRASSMVKWRSIPQITDTDNEHGREYDKRLGQDIDLKSTTLVKEMLVDLQISDANGRVLESGDPRAILQVLYEDWDKDRPRWDGTMKGALILFAESTGDEIKVLEAESRIMRHDWSSWKAKGWNSELEYVAQSLAFASDIKDYLDDAEKAVDEEDMSHLLLSRMGGRWIRTDDGKQVYVLVDRARNKEARTFTLFHEFFHSMSTLISDRDLKDLDQVAVGEGPDPDTGKAGIPMFPPLTSGEFHSQMNTIAARMAQIESKMLANDPNFEADADFWKHVIAQVSPDERDPSALPVLLFLARAKQTDTMRMLMALREGSKDMPEVRGSILTPETKRKVGGKRGLEAGYSNYVESAEEVWARAASAWFIQNHGTPEQKEFLKNHQERSMGMGNDMKTAEVGESIDMVVDFSEADMEILGPYIEKILDSWGKLKKI